MDLRCQRETRAFSVFHFGHSQTEISLELERGSWLKMHDSAEGRWNGKGASAPDRLDSNGLVRLALAPRGVVVYSSPAEPPRRSQS